ncbi:MAG: OmpA family protein [Bacteroidota bacterium]
MKKIYTLLLVVLFASVSAQNVTFEKSNFPDKKEDLKIAKKAIEEGDNYYLTEYQNYNRALELYLQAQEFNPNNDELNFKIGDCYIHSGFKLKSLPYLEKAYKLNPKVSPEILYLLGRANHLNLKLDEAKKFYNKYKQSLDGKDVVERTNKANKGIDECNNGIELMKNPIRVFIDNLGPTVNTKDPEYTPVVTADEDGLYITSRRSNSTGGELDAEGIYFEDVYVSYNFNKKWSAAQNLGEPINTKVHDATMGVSPDGQKLFVYRNEGGNGEIFECDLEGDKWSEPHRMKSPVNSKAHESSASISFDGKKLFFVSQREGGLGDRDIYIATKNVKGKWDDVENIGPTINTPYGDEGAFIMPDGKTLYFSSQGHNSMGGYDIFKTVYANGKWSKPENIGYPVNTPDDDVFFVMAASGKRGYFSSIREGGYGEKDIYMVSFLGPEKLMVLNTEDNLIASQAAPVSEVVAAPVVAITESALTILKGVVTDAITLKPLEAEIDIVDNVRNESIASFKSNSKTGKYLVSLPAGKNYGIAVKANNYLFHSENFDIPLSAGYQEVVKDVALKNIAVGSKIVLKNIFFDVDKSTLKPESTNELERLLKLLTDVPTLKIEIAGHTDSDGSDDHNNKLSQARSEVVVKWLTEKGIPISRLQAKGYGETKPIATNDTKEGKSQNRRTEFEIIAN